MGVHDSGPNKPAEWVEQQGPKAIRKLYALMKNRIKAFHSEERILDGATGFLDCYGLTSGAKSFDGTCYSCQVSPITTGQHGTSYAASQPDGHSVARGG